MSRWLVERPNFSKPCHWTGWHVMDRSCDLDLICDLDVLWLWCIVQWSMVVAREWLEARIRAFSVPLVSLSQMRGRLVSSEMRKVCRLEWWKKLVWGIILLLLFIYKYQERSSDMSPQLNST